MPAVSALWPPRRVTRTPPPPEVFPNLNLEVLLKKTKNE